MKFDFPNLPKEQRLFLLIAAAIFFAGFIFIRRAKLIADAKAARDQTVSFIHENAVNSPPPGADQTMAQVIPLYPGTAGYAAF